MSIMVRPHWRKTRRRRFVGFDFDASVDGTLGSSLTSVSVVSAPGNKIMHGAPRPSGPPFVLGFKQLLSAY